MSCTPEEQSNSGPPTRTKWDDAIADAQSEMQRAQSEMIRLRARINRLRNAIKTFQDNKRDGVRWPGDEETTG